MNFGARKLRPAAPATKPAKPDRPKRPRGFQTLTPAKRRRIARLGGLATRKTRPAAVILRGTQFAAWDQ
jgi:hypothetical protein